MITPPRLQSDPGQSNQDCSGLKPGRWSIAVEFYPPDASQSSTVRWPYIRAWIAQEAEQA
jgi:hypothetical protein